MAVAVAVVVVLNVEVVEVVPVVVVVVVVIDSSFWQNAHKSDSYQLTIGLYDIVQYFILGCSCSGSRSSLWLLVYFNTLRLSPLR